MQFSDRVEINADPEDAQTPTEHRNKQTGGDHPPAIKNSARHIINTPQECSGRANGFASTGDAVIYCFRVILRGYVGGCSKR